MTRFQVGAGSSKRRRRWLELLFLVVGVAALGVWAWSLVEEGVYQDWSNWAFDRETAGERISLADYLRERWAGNIRSTEPVPVTRTETPTKASVKNGLVGRLEIPRLHLEAVVREGTGDKTLDVALGHISGTALPGQNGNVAIAGHRDRLFRGLKDIEPSDQIVFETLHTKFVYQVEGTQIVKPAEVSVLKAGVYPELTLVTCYPFSYIGSAPDRFIVKARQVAQIPTGQTLPEATVAAVAPATTQPAVARPAPNKHGVEFEVSGNHSRQLASGISIGLTRADPIDKSADGWMWVMPDRRTIWLRSLHVGEPLVFYPDFDGRRRELVLTGVTDDSIRGYLVTASSGTVSDAARDSSTIRMSASSAIRFPAQR